jgi:predicted transcriptional regulator
MQALTKAEEEIMQILWKLGKGFVKDILEQFPEPKPAYNTVSTFVRILETKGFVSYKALGKTHEYFPLVSKDEYKKAETEKLLEGYFENSVESLFSFFIEKQKIDVREADEILKMIEKMKNQNGQ